MDTKGRMTTMGIKQESVPVVEFGKIPGEIQSLSLGDEPLTVSQLFTQAGLDLRGCQLFDREGHELREDAVVRPGDRILAVTKIRGNN